MNKKKKTAENLVLCLKSYLKRYEVLYVIPDLNILLRKTIKFLEEF